MIASNTYPFAGRTVLVTGAGSGIGRSIARAFLEQGASVAVAGRTPATLEETVAGFPAERVLVVPTDVSVRAEVDALVEGTVARFGGIDVLVNNAAGHLGGPIEEVEDDAWRSLFATNVDALFYAVKAALPHLKASRGNIVVVSSVSGIRGDWGQAAHNATKGAITTFVQSLALDFGAHGVRVNAVAPAFTQTPLTESMASTPEELAPFIDRIALGRPGQPDDIAPPVLFLASADAAYITGAILAVDGGTSASTGQPHL
ncbi:MULTISPECIES: SDR family NAD(P)-dependent oxidoreductase [unclassified Rathayibacter]|uniref:SDR family NAD(P)-dependent oxidoreductase n=1 Tax=unclassified Rathayibacter TaxID=2609250 RepID=UPI002157DF95|nr:MULTISPECIES: SDR family NAD(P)-dependent oxidoreductase [unclassified Rathayibacter]